jgi:hypothetical protein
MMGFAHEIEIRQPRLQISAVQGAILRGLSERPWTEHSRKSRQRMEMHGLLLIHDDQRIQLTALTSDDR